LSRRALPRQDPPRRDADSRAEPVDTRELVGRAARKERDASQCVDALLPLSPCRQHFSASCVACGASEGTKEALSAVCERPRPPQSGANVGLQHW
jgi:hypothetical protein